MHGLVGVAEVITSVKSAEELGGIASTMTANLKVLLAKNRSISGDPTKLKAAAKAFKTIFELVEDAALLSGDPKLRALV